VDHAEELLAQRAPSRLFAHDHTLWSPDPTELANRMGWTDEPTRVRADADRLQAFADAAADDGIDHVVWCGMGGSSLFPELLATSSLVASGAPSMRVVDTSHPAAVQRAAVEARERNTLYAFASKSGGTVETRSHLEYFWQQSGEPSRFVAITDPGSALDALATERGFRGIFHANPEIGGRYSALSHFGVVAAAMLGIDLDALLGGAEAMAGECAADTASNPGLVLAACIGAAREGRDKAVLDCDAAFGAWLEQLIAESTGKHDTGIVPVPGAVADADGPDRLRVSYGAGGDLDIGRDAPTATAERLGGEVMRWEVATALAGALLHINPFDQPDVEAAKQAARRALDEGVHSPDPVGIDDALATAAPGRYVALQAFVDPQGEVARNLDRLRVAVRDRTGAAVTAAVGPRYLHSTGQLHKGGPPSVVCVQVLDEDLPDVAVPGADYSFATLLVAQAAGDLAALQSRGRQAARVRAADLLAL
jgi:transaldolase/glucose-6-phosphate isomerase